MGLASLFPNMTTLSFSKLQPTRWQLQYIVGKLGLDTNNRKLASDIELNVYSYHMYAITFPP